MYDRAVYYIGPLDMEVIHSVPQYSTRSAQGVLRLSSQGATMEPQESGNMRSQPWRGWSARD